MWRNFEPALAIYDATVEFFISVNQHMLKNDLAIWSHCCVGGCDREIGIPEV